MIKKAVLFSLMAIATENIYSQDIESASIININNLAILLTLIVAIAALIISIINAFRISYNRKISEVNLVNQKDDINVSMEGINTVLTRDIRNIRKEMNRSSRNQKPKEPTSTNNPAAATQDSKKNTSEEDKNPPKRKMNNNKRRFYRKKPTNKNPGKEGAE